MVNEQSDAELFLAYAEERCESAFTELARRLLNFAPSPRNSFAPFLPAFLLAS
jgi:hypothetical protein